MRSDRRGQLVVAVAKATEQCCAGRSGDAAHQQLPGLGVTQHDRHDRQGVGQRERIGLSQPLDVGVGEIDAFRAS